MQAQILAPGGRAHRPRLPSQLASERKHGSRRHHSSNEGGRFVSGRSVRGRRAFGRRRAATLLLGGTLGRVERSDVIIDSDLQHAALPATRSAGSRVVRVKCLWNARLLPMERVHNSNVRTAIVVCRNVTRGLYAAA